MVCGLLGRTLGHSYSPQIHGKLWDYDYNLFEVEPENLEQFLKSGTFSGLNVTIPYKKDVIPYLDELSPVAARLGAVNTIVRRKDGSLLGHNTDYFGFQTMVNHSGISAAGKKALVLGSGGASSMAVAALQDLGAEVVVISRKGENNYGNMAIHQDAALLVNATPVGMYPNVGISHVDLDLFPKLEGVLDLIYNPARTRLLLDAEQKGLITENGLLMLVAQAWESAQWFTGEKIPQDRIAEIHRQLRNQMENLVLIGMPGCGKSTLGMLLAQKLNRKFVDADAELVKKYGPIPAIFEAEGEEGFRKKETEILMELGKQSSLVLATGGGCVTREENYDLLHQNGRIFRICRDLNDLPADGRPLSQREGVQALYEKRKPMYEAFADYSVDNNSGIETAAAEILKTWEAQTMKILVLNGPNINMLGIREPGIYGSNSYEDLKKLLEDTAKEENITMEHFQSNHEGALVDKIQEAYGKVDGIVINPAAYTHTSVAILDALKAVSIPAVEVHISDVDSREDFRQISYAGKYCEKTIKGQGIDGYRQAMVYLKEKYGN